MLEQLRKSGASIAIYLIFGLLIIIFVINFAPNAGQGGGGCNPGGSVMTVGSSKLNQSAYHVAYAANKYSGRQKVYAALEMMIRRELLADGASAAGIRVTKDAVEDEMKKGYFFYAGFRIPDYQTDPMGGPQFVSEHSFFDVVDGDRFFNIGKFKGWVNSLNVSVGSYYDEQARAMQAALYSELLQESVRVSRDEALSDYLFASNTVSYDTVTFDPAVYRDAMRLSDADVTRFIAGHEADVKKKFTDEERTYKATKPALKLRQIKLDFAPAEPKPADAPKPPDGAGSGSGSGSAAPAEPKKVAEPAKPAEPKKLTLEEAKAKLEAARTAIGTSKQKFIDTAKALSTDDATKWNGGDVGWKQVDNAGLGDKAINDAVKALKPGEVTAVVAGETAVYLVMADDKREGDLTFDQVKAEIAAEMARDVWSKEAAKRAALDAFKAAHAGTAKNLSDLFERGVNQREQQRQMQEMIEQQMQQQHGSLVSHEKDHLASWQASDDKAPAGTAGSAAPAAGSAAPAAGSAAPGAGSGNAAGAPTTPPPAPAPVELTPSSDVLPAFGDVKKPKVVAETKVQKQKDMPGLETVADAGTVLFDELQAGMLGKKVYETPEGFVLLQLIDKQAPKVEDFDKIADQEIARIRSIRGRMAVEGWLKTRCEALKKDGKIKPAADLVHETDDAGKPLPQVYVPCMSFR